MDVIGGCWEVVKGNVVEFDVVFVLDGALMPFVQKIRGKET